ncbi:hypothetical protein CGT95_00515 [Vibrio metoecus]|nr:hypothetical protein CGT95_00515 [Vibrio metoecus]
MPPENLGSSNPRNLQQQIPEIDNWVTALLLVTEWHFGRITTATMREGFQQRQFNMLKMRSFAKNRQLPSYNPTER